MLAVDVDQVLGGLAQLRHGGRAAVDPGAALALRVDGAAQQQAVVVALEAGLVQPGASDGGVSNSAVTSARVAPSRTSAGIGAVAQRQLQRVDEDGLARAGLAGQHREAGVELELQLGDDDDDVAQGVSLRSTSAPSQSQRCSQPCSPRGTGFAGPPGGAPLGGSAEGASGGGHTTPSYQRSLRRSVA
jgi:hypothetical protein